MKKKKYLYLMLICLAICVSSLIVLDLVINKVVANQPETTVTEEVTEESVPDETETEPEPTTEEITTEEESTEDIVGLNNNDLLGDIDKKNIDSFMFGNHKMVLPCKLSELIGEDRIKAYEGSLRDLFNEEKDTAYYDFTVMTDEQLHKAVCILFLSEPYNEKNFLDNIYIRQISTSEPTMSVCGVTVGSTSEEVINALKEYPNFYPIGSEQGSIYLYRSIHYRFSCVITDDIVTQMTLTYIGDDPSMIIIE